MYNSGNGVFYNGVQSVSPVGSGDAKNGVSLDTDGDVVLGNRLNDAAAPGRLLNNREIWMQSDSGARFGLTLNQQGTGLKTLLRGDRVAITGVDATSGLLSVITGDDGTATLQAVTGLAGTSVVSATAGDGGISVLRVGSGTTDLMEIAADGNGAINFNIQGTFASMQVNTTTICTKFQSDTGAAFNGATVQISGTCTKRFMQRSFGDGTIVLDRDLDSAKSLRNNGATIFELPTMIGSDFREGFYIDVLCNNAAGVTISATAGVTILYGTTATSAGGNISSVDVGSFIRVMIIDSTTFCTCFSIGNWTVV